MYGAESTLKRKSRLAHDNGHSVGGVSGTWLEFSVAQSAGNMKVSFQTARSIC
jgi:hypothetical protein